MKSIMRQFPAIGLLMFTLDITSIYASTNDAGCMSVPLEMQKEDALNSLQALQMDVQNMSTNAYTNVSTLIIFQQRWTDDQILQNLSSWNYRLVVSSLSILATRGNTNGAQTARRMLATDFGWLNGARYLGKIGDKTSIPYLIKGLRVKSAKGLYVEIGAILSELTGESYGTNYDSWHSWWMNATPGSDFDFDSHLTKSAPETWNPEDSGTKP